jgi:hypothetical protein
MHKRKIVDGDNSGTRAPERGNKIWAVQQVWTDKLQLKRKRPLLKPIMRRGHNNAPLHIWRDHKRTQHLPMLEADKLIFSRDLGESSKEIPRILWYATTTVRV